MNQNFSLLTYVSNNNINLSIYITLLVILWLAVASELVLTTYILARVFLTKNTIRAKWWMLPVGLIIGGALIASSILLNNYGLETEIWVTMTVMGGLMVLILCPIYIIKIVNCVNAKKHHMSERKWCVIQSTKYFLKKIVAKISIHGLKKITQNMSLAQKRKFYTKLIKAFSLFKKWGKSSNVIRKDLLDAVSRIIDNFKK